MRTVQKWKRAKVERCEEGEKKGAGWLGKRQESRSANRPMACAKVQIWKGVNHNDGRVGTACRPSCI